ncbi:MAG: family 14 glycosylhydrolase [Fimbriimonadaceae bacterium]|nr:family 14 glycosylhydrolase [Fimbriimonadaceae bacterium]
MRLLGWLLLGVTAAGARTASVELGEVNRSQGLTVPSAGDGENVAASIGGRAARIATGARSLYTYVAVDAALFPPGDHTLYVTFDLWDDGPRVLRLQYDSVAAQPSIATKYRDGGALLLLGSGGWVRRTAKLEHARLGKGQNHATDLRVSGVAYIARIEVSDAPPAGWDAQQLVPPEDLARLRTPIGAGVELCVGAEPDLAEALILEALGVTSIETYVTWQTVEDAGRGQWDWSRWDAQVAVLRQAGLKWVPFLIAGPAYATPKWFREGPQHFPYVCLEHQQPTKVESLWNPALRPEIERFLAAFAERYRDSGVIESVLLGITGIYGESIYPAGPSDGWTMDIPGPYHNHGGWWAGDRRAAADFRTTLRRRYGDLARLNAAWGTQYASFEAVPLQLPSQYPAGTARADFVRWYEESMTEWSRWWVEVTRKQFPTTAIYLCTGGDGSPFLGADFTAQAKAIAPYGAGIRITNEASSYPHNFAITREVATATRLYQTFAGFEPAGQVDEWGVGARIYNATASGIRQLHYYAPNLLGSGPATANWRAAAAQWQARRPLPPTVAVYLPREAWAQGATPGASYSIVHALREYVDVDLVTATSVADGALRAVKALVIPPTPSLEPAAERAIQDWCSAGGLLLQCGPAGPLPVVVRPVDPLPATVVLQLGAAADEVYLSGDWNGPERGAEFPQTPTKRWSGAAPGLLLPVQPGQPVSLRLEVLAREVALRDGGGAAVVNGQEVGRLKPGYQILAAELPGNLLTSPLAKLELRVRGWQPSEQDRTTDDRVLGVAVGRVELRRAGGPAEAPPNQSLVAVLERARLTVVKQGAGAAVTLPVGAYTSQPVLSGLLGEVARELGLGDLRLDDLTDGVYATALPDGLLWYNAGALPAVKRGVTIPPRSIASTPR